ncbi:uncharacterized protein [Clytia hemisphaerica]|uniref:uncharacterized protein n=1 Tax=Clytia hemisphaerica TaxID=252671 RepID=UPI0034D749EB
MCMLAFQVPHKSKRLVLVGDIDSGKTSVMNMFFGLIPEQKIATVTKERVFGLSMIKSDTELLIIDEWTKDMTSADMVKVLFQGGRFPQSVKFEDPKLQEMNAGVFITCNHVPKFPKKDRKSVLRRIADVNTRELEVLCPEAPEWIRKNAMHCLKYLIDMINNNLDVIDQSELSYTLPQNVRCESTILEDEVEKEELDRIRDCVVEADDSVPLVDSSTKELEVFRVDEDVDEVLESDSTSMSRTSDIEQPNHLFESDALNIDELLGIISSTEAELSDIEPPKKRSRTLFLPSDDEDDTTIRELLNDLIDHVSAENTFSIDERRIVSTNNRTESNDVVESPIKQDELKSPRRFKIEEVNLVEYWRLVRKFLFKKLGYKKLNGPVACSIFQIHDKYVKSLTTPRPPTVAKPRDDAAFLVLNKPRATFDTRAFYKRYLHLALSKSSLFGKKSTFAFQLHHFEPEVIVISSDDERCHGKDETLVKRKISKRNNRSDDRN